MTVLIIGGSKCGKSSLAESIISRFGGKKIYLATMQPYGDDARAIIERHKEQRKNKGFETVERYTDIGQTPLPEDCAVLLECIGNLCANEMFSGESISYPAEKIVKDLHRLAGRVRELVIVSVRVGSDGITYEEGTAAYIGEIGKINSGIAAFADNVIECVFGIPVVLKGELPCLSR
ncbi:MAG: bifunctional adenosylcobinamide kinase/adenosylcobinamide-phosphate guanylyltransferase [Ruminococcus sp.]|nr:bifunctional adenosylcobinamide kinase/adenosylcobinamide-phosphate guanylyltransferase [Ruminococcus sp.]